MILVFGSINIDLVARVSSIPRPGETVLSPRYETLFGGKGANQAVAAARASEAGRVVMAACIGDDGFGRDARANLDAQGVGTAFINVCEEPTGCAFITVDEAGENAITVASGANLALTHAAVPTNGVQGSTILVLQMEVPFAESLAIAERTKEAGGRVIWNLAPAPASFGPSELRRLLAAVDFLVVNEHEALMTATLIETPRSPTDAAALLAKVGDTNCIVTLGEKGAVAFLSDGSRVEARAAPVDVVDTTGAGDTFVGILASALDEGLGLTASLERACEGASMSCLKIGAQTGMPTRIELVDRPTGDR
jgi:ribokinase